MPRTCAVLGCLSNCETTFKEGKKSVSTFSFPKDKTLREAWVVAILRMNWTPSEHSSVCARHFDASEIITHDELRTENGQRKLVPRSRPKLLPTAIPRVVSPIIDSKDIALYKRKMVMKPRPPREVQDVVQEVVREVKKVKYSNITNFVSAGKSSGSIPPEIQTEFAPSNRAYNYTITNLKKYFDLSVTDNNVYKDKKLYVSIVVESNKLSMEEFKWVLPIDLDYSNFSESLSIVPDYLLPTTTITFMVCSPLGSVNEAVKILPVANVDYFEMLVIVKNVVEFIQKCGFEVMCMMTDQ